ncbi:uncharacterized protein PAC_14164 [Phialocephala subalpina]|uniref:Uncharacterized protein n=1 Tax=Phialocephala subalpina TaxID=576137 RepID=A0A1L7XH40_9HELO|nr:uncharacterized protein PAC_14164 [Phialocephala subalpina]
MGIDVAHQFWAKRGGMSSLTPPARLNSLRKPRLPAKTETACSGTQLPVGKTNLGTQNSANFLSDGLELILAASTIEQICLRRGMINTRLGFGIENLKDPNGLSTDFLKRTIEIRIHGSTLYPQDVENWVRLFIGVVHFASVVRVENLEK